ncbi:peptidase inhibitor family I36 protein [Streptomyces sp. NPDC001493]
MKLTLKTAVVAAAIASTAVLTVPGTASADPVKDPACMGGKICFYDGHDNTGEMLQISPADIPYIDWAWNDRISSVWNLSGGQVCIYTDADYYGYNFSIPAGGKQELLFLYDNAVSSISVSGCGG